MIKVRYTVNDALFLNRLKKIKFDFKKGLNWKPIA